MSSRGRRRGNNSGNGGASHAQHQRAKLRFTLGGEQAEADPLLRESFYNTAQYDALSSRDDPKCFVIGRTGSGKSAMLQQIEEEHPGHVIRITPEDLSLPYISGLGAIKHLVEQEVHLSPFFIALWKHIFLVEIIRHRYAVDSATAKQNFLATLRDRISQDKSKLAALEYLNDFGDRFWCETDERVREITEKFEEQVKAQGGVGNSKLGISAGLESSGTRTLEHRTELVDRYQKIVNDTQLPRLNKMIAVLDEDILDSPQHFTWIIIDDLDRDWVDDKIANDLILCLFRAVSDLKRVENLKVLVALRANIFVALDFAGRHGGQEEKFRALTMHLRWTEADICGMLDERVSTVAGRFKVSNEYRNIHDVLPAENPRRGDALKFVLRRTLMRPRDAIAYINACYELSAGQPKITWDHLNDAEATYSHNRLLALRDEWKPSYPGLDRVLSAFAGAPGVISPERIRPYLDDAAMLLANSDFGGRDWLMDVTKPVWEGHESADKGLEPFKALIELLFNIGFLGVRQATPKAIFSQDQPDFFNQHHAFGSVGSFVIHPAFWAALGVGRRDDI